jgi:branched-chain amino acid transport system substrate-binding protein
MMKPEPTSSGSRKFAAVVLASSLAVAGCASSSSTTAATTAAPASTAAAAAPTTAAAAVTTAAPATTAAPTTAAAAVTTAKAATGADRTGQTIKVGLVNQDGGPIPFPDFRAGAEVAIKNINATGGINGAKLEVVSCATSLSPESSINCANKMIEAKVAFAYLGADFTAEASQPVYGEAGLPLITTVGWGPSLETSKGVHILSSANAATAVGALALAQNLKLTKIALAHDAVPAAVNFATKTIPPIAKAMGIEVQDITVDPAAPDYAAIVATAQAGGAQAFWGIQAEPGCTAMVTAAVAANFKGPIIAGSCTDYIKALGEKAVGTYTVLTQLVPDTGGGASAEIGKRLVDFQKLMTDSGQDKVISGNSIAAFGAWTELATVLKRITGDINAKSVDAALTESVALPGWFRPDTNCGAKAWPDAPTYCSAQVSVWQVEKKADGTFGRKVTMDFFDAFKKSTAK